MNPTLIRVMLVLQATPDKTEGLCEDTAAVEAFDATSPPKERAWIPILYLPQFFRRKITEKRPGNGWGVRLYQDSVAMVDLMLNNLGRPAGEGLNAGLKFLVLPLNLNRLISLALTGAAQQRKTPFFSFISS